MVDGKEAYVDKIIVNDLVARALVGPDLWGRIQPQPVHISAVVHTDVAQAGRSDHLPHSIHYGVLCRQLEKCATESACENLSELAERLAEVCVFVCHAPVVTLRVEAPRLLLRAAAAGIEIVRSGQDYVVSSQSLAASSPTAPEAPPRLPHHQLAADSPNAPEDIAFVKDLELPIILGVNPCEREDKQMVRIGLRWWPRLTGGAMPLHDVRSVVKGVQEYAESSSYQTVESLATALARITIQRSGLPRVAIRVDKPSALMFAGSSAVEVKRDRDFFEREQRTPAAAQRRDFSTSTAEQVTNSATEKHIAAIALGSNLGDRARNLELACKELEKRGCKVVDTSFIYETAPMYVTEQPTFLNAVCKITTSLGPFELMRLCQAIEKDLGRSKIGVVEKGPRVVDLDIIFYDQQVIDQSPELNVPHAGLKEREFVLRPLVDVMPHHEHPKLKQTVSQILSQIQNSPDYVDPQVRRVLPLPSAVSSETVDGKDGRRLWTWSSKTFVMSIINATPDSFSDGGDHFAVSDAVASARKMVDEGADVLDIGGMSTRPNAADVSPEEEAGRVVPLIQQLRAEGVTVPISVDTFRASVAEAALDAGADIVNDVSGGAADERMIPLVASRGVPYVLMHMRGDPKTMSQMSEYEGGDVLGGVKKELEDRVRLALEAGVRRWNIILDPGIGFAKDVHGNLDLLKHLAKINGPVSAASLPTSDELVPSYSDAPNASLSSFPILVGASRKRFLGALTGRSEPKERAFGTAAACTAAIAGGCDVIRVHDTAEMVDVAKTADAIFRKQ